jgi:hypothetical protein
MGIATNKNLTVDAVAAWLLDDGISSYKSLRNNALINLEDNNNFIEKQKFVPKQSILLQPSEKICRHCGLFKPRTEFKKGMNICNSCSSKKQTVSITKQKEKKCLKCGETKPLDQFYHKKSSSDGRNSYCIQCMNLYVKGKRKNRGIKKNKKLKKNRTIKKSNDIIKDSSNWKRNLILEKIEKVKNNSNPINTLL